MSSSPHDSDPDMVRALMLVALMVALFWLVTQPSPESLVTALTVSAAILDDLA